MAFAMLACALAFAGTAWAQQDPEDGQYVNDDFTVEQATTPETRTTADSLNSDDLRAEDDVRGAAGFSCVDIVEISQSGSRNQYNFSSARLQECLAREVVGETKGRLADTGGPPLLPIAAFVLVGAGIFMGRAVLSRRDG